MKKRSVVTLLVLFTVFLFFLTSIPVHAQGKAMKLRLSLQWPPQHPITKNLEQWGKDVEKATEGRITVTVFASNTLSPPMQAPPFRSFATTSRI
jgi:TRAP-type C4-dicarboxylate transport system substrate-binding protein